jgi:hypothetical protein
VPGDHGVRFDDDKGRSPIFPNFAQPCPDEPISWIEFWSLYGAMQHGELLPEREVLQM